MRTWLITTVGALALMAALPAGAADLSMPVKAPPPAPFFDWTGLYVGVNAGGGFGQSDFSSFNAARVNDFNGSTDTSGPFGGGQIGLNYQIGPSWLIGIEADAEWAAIEGSSTGCTATGCATGHSDLDMFGTARGRIGWVWDRVLLYGTGGWAFSHSETDRTINCVGATCAGGGPGVASPLVNQVAGSAGWQDGWAAGAGIEWGFYPAWTFKLEYQHLQFDGFGRDFKYTGAGSAGAFRHTQSNDGIETFRIGVNRIINWTPPPGS
jgi:outer membrane immunogenic protein